MFAGANNVWTAVLSPCNASRIFDMAIIELIGDLGVKYLCYCETV